MHFFSFHGCKEPLLPKKIIPFCYPQDYTIPPCGIRWSAVVSELQWENQSSKFTVYMQRDASICKKMFSFQILGSFILLLSHFYVMHLHNRIQHSLIPRNPGKCNCLIIIRTTECSFRFTPCGAQCHLKCTNMAAGADAKL